MSVCVNASDMHPCSWEQRWPRGRCQELGLSPHRAPPLYRPNLISSYATSGEGPRAAAISKSAAQLFTISWLSEICVSLINVAISRLKCHTYLTTKAEFYPQFGGKRQIIIKAFSEKSGGGLK